MTPKSAVGFFRRCRCQHKDDQVPWNAISCYNFSHMNKIAVGRKDQCQVKRLD